MPVNIPHHSRRRARTRRSSPERSQSIARAGVASAIRAAPSPPASGLAPAPPEHDRGDEQPQLVDLAGVEEGACQGRAALEQEGGDARAARARRAPRRRGPADPRRRRSARPRRLRSASARSPAAAGEAITTSGASPIEPTSREPSGRRASESKTTRVGWRTSAAARGRSRREQRVVGERGADPDADGVALGPPAVHQRAAGLAGDPPGVAARGRHAAVEAEGRLQEDERASCAGVLSKRLIQKPRERPPPGRSPARPRRPRRGGFPGRGRSPSRSDPRRRSRRAPPPPRGWRRCTAAGARGARRARASRTASLPTDRGLERGSRRGPRPRRGDRRAGRGSPRRSARRRARAPRRRAGWG